MDIRANVGSFCYDLQNGIWEVFGVRTGKANSHFRGDGGHTVKKVGKTRTLASPKFEHFFETCSVLMDGAGSEFVQVRIYILTEEGNFFEAFVSEHNNFFLNTFQRPGPLSAPCKRHNTKRTHIIAPPHDAHPSSHPIGVPPHRLDVRISLILTQLHINGL